MSKTTDKKGIQWQFLLMIWFGFYPISMVDPESNHPIIETGYAFHSLVNSFINQNYTKAGAILNLKYYNQKIYFFSTSPS